MANKFEGLVFYQKKKIVRIYFKRRNIYFQIENRERRREHYD